MRDIAVEVDEQGENLNVISDDLLKANGNVVQANADMDDANEMHRKSRKLKVCIVATILVLVVMAIGVIVILKLV